MSTYWINLYPKGLDGQSDDPDAYAYATDAFPPTRDHGIRLKITIPDEVKAEIVR